jgi:hypothetical protein
MASSQYFQEKMRGRVISPENALSFVRRGNTSKPLGCKLTGEIMRRGWQFLSLRWWVVHFLGFALVYTAGRLTAAFLKG